jgi:flagellar biosynthetic protein FliR
MAPAAVLQFALLLVRPGLLVMTTPFLGGVYAPTTARIGLTVLVALILFPLVTTPVDFTTGSLVFVVGREVLIGLALSMGVRVLIFAFDAAGQLLGYQLGLSYGSIVDPQSGVRNAVLAALYTNLAIVLALAGGAHHAILRALMTSYTALPMGLGGVDASLVPAVARMLGVVLVLAVRVAAPVIVVLLATEALLGLMARVAPAFNVMIVGAPARVVVGLLVVAATLISLPPLVARYAPVTLELAADTARAFR